MSQLRHVDDGLELNAMEATHPALVIRARALLWFSMNESFMKPAGRGVQQELRKLDRRVEEDLSRYVDGSVRRLIAEAKDALLLWVVADHVVREGAFRREHQSTIGGFMDGELLDGLRRFLGNLAPETARAEVASRLALASDELRSLIPTTFANEYSEIRQFVAGKLETK